MQGATGLVVVECQATVSTVSGEEMGSPSWMALHATCRNLSFILWSQGAYEKFDGVSNLDRTTFCRITFRWHTSACM